MWTIVTLLLDVLTILGLLTLIGMVLFVLTAMIAGAIEVFKK